MGRGPALAAARVEGRLTLDRPRFRRLIDLLGDALLLPTAERAAFVERECGGNATLLAEARSLLAEAEATSLAAVTARIGAAIERAADSLRDAGHTMPERIGPYRILGVLGAGGMGLVYRAEQMAPLRREVAIKLVRGGLRGEDARLRFEAERQTLAAMNHPGIARIFDAGSTDDGLPWFAMELVPGVPITAFCDGQRLDIDARCGLLAEVCGAVQHAHVNGIIHRDLKPTNILVSLVDGRAQPRIIDFGIAKAVEAAAGAETMHTELGTVVGTLEYMRPEQAAGGRAPVDTRSDVYSLGVILYELVSGALPFDSDRLRQAGAIDAQRLIRDTDPPTPARRYMTTAERGAIAQIRDTDPRSLQRKLGGDLGWIIMKALEKDPARRYQSASALAADLDHVVRSEPVEAGPPSRRYRAARFVRRHRTVVVAAGLVFLALVAGIAVATTGLVSARRAQARAENEGRRATMIKDFLTGMLSRARPENSRGREVTVREVVDSMATEVERNRTFADDPLVRGELLHAIGETYRTLDQCERAVPLFKEALALKRSAPGDNSRSTLVTLNKLSQCQAATGDLRGAIETQKDVLTLAEKALGKTSTDYVDWLANLGSMYADVGDFTHAERIMRDVLAIDRSTRASDKEALPFSLNNLATILVDEGKYAEAVSIHEESIALRRRYFGEPSAEVAVALANYARALSGAGRLAQADTAAHGALAMSMTVFGPNHQRTATARLRLAEVMLRGGRPGEAEPLLRDAIATYRGINERSWRVGDSRARLGEALLAKGLKVEGIHELEAGWEIYTATNSPSAPRSREIAQMIAAYYDGAAKPAEAERWHRRAAPPSGG